MIWTKCDLLCIFMHTEMCSEFVNLLQIKNHNLMKIRQSLKCDYQAPSCEELFLCPEGLLAASFVGEKLTEDDTDAYGSWVGINN